MFFAQLLASWIADPGVISSIPTRPHPFVGIDHEIFYMFFSPPSVDSKKAVVSYTQKYVHLVLVKHFV